MTVATVTLSKFSQMQCRLRGIFFQAYQLNKKENILLIMHYRETFLGFLLYVFKPSDCQFFSAGIVFLITLQYFHNARYSGSDSGASQPGSQST